MPKYINTTSVKRIVGISDELENQEIDQIINEVESEVQRLLNTRFDLTEKIDFLRGSNLNTIATEKNPILRLKNIKVDDESIDLSKVRYYNGIIQMKVGDDQTISKFRDFVMIKYDYGKLKETQEKTSTTSDTSSGDTVIPVSDESDFEKEEIVLIKGLDGNHEAVKVESVSDGQITVDLTTLNHESGSSVIKLKLDEVYKRLMQVIAGIVVSTRLVGQTYTVATSYSLGEFSVTKGVPYTHWQEVANKLIKERDRLLDKLQPSYVIV